MSSLEQKRGDVSKQKRKEIEFGVRCLSNVLVLQECFVSVVLEVIIDRQLFAALSR